MWHSFGWKALEQIKSSQKDTHGKATSNHTLEMPNVPILKNKLNKTAELIIIIRHYRQ
jgi:hypothetical protein